ncbi:hypothetical protein [Rhodanobacter spathiphylli]|uniref:Uncharacterized protein n=1 Tax=Rhodanobacter spathiphylli B39 TaxID=1163407 RepID=I4W4D2_9GAMM|nr:hypothetical protein [Rhodanobacter spathiphylli]EIL94323.1 hypothetical protein UU7_04967 [Rhodanobacter spathiphylli B39]
MRGKIIQYNGADGTGTLVVDGRQHRFTLDAWRAYSAPTTNKVVDVTLDNDLVTAVAAVGDDVLLREKASELGSKFGTLLHKIPTTLPSDMATRATARGADTPAGAPGDAAIGGSIIERYGKPILLAYLLFLIGTLALDAVSVSAFGQGMGKSLFDIASLMSQLGGHGGGSIKMLLLVAYASIAMPMLWRNRSAWLALAMPLLALLWAIFSTIHALDSLGRGVADGMSDFFSIGFGFYLSLVAALALAALGMKRAVRVA